MSFDIFGVFESGMEEFLSPSAASVILQASADKCGRYLCKRITRKVKTKDKVLAYLSNLKDSMNWGKMSFRDVDFHKGTGKITVLDSFETIARKSSHTCCHFLLGFLAGFLSELFAREIMVTEKECAGKGDAHCEFEFCEL